MMGSTQWMEQGIAEVPRGIAEGSSGMDDYKRYWSYPLSQSVKARAKWAFGEICWKRGIDIPADIEDQLPDILEHVIRASLNAARSGGWFDPKGLPEGEKQSYKVLGLQDYAKDGSVRAKMSKYGFHLMDAGKSYVVDVAKSDMPRLRAAATSYANAHGWAFRVNKDKNGAIVTRIE